MRMKREFEEAYEKMIESDGILPKEWQGVYEAAACLKDSPGKKTYLLKDKADGKKYVLKLAMKEEAVHLLEEGRILQEFQKTENKDDLTEQTEIRIKELIDCGETVYLIRNYIEGKSLAEIGEMRSFSEKEIFHIGIQLCRNVMKLHQRKPPVIHRDIKPENIIIKKDGSLVLIDLETARVYKKGKREDTYFAGTRQTAAPEQYGFGQSDERTDIYGIGRTLLYMKTGDYLLEDMEKASGNRRLNGVIRKCCSFDPDSRFESVEKLLYELYKCQPAVKGEKRSLRILTAMVLILCAAVVVLSWQVISLRKEMSVPAAAEAGQGNGESRFFINGWDVTDYDLLVEQIVDSCEQKDYQLMTKQCSQLITELYEDEMLRQVETEDTWYYAADDERWEPYHIIRLGYEKVADTLAYHDGMLEAEVNNLEEYKYYIASVIRNAIEATEIDEEGNIVHTLLYQYKNKESVDRVNIDHSIYELMSAIIVGIESYQTEN
ncbi:MAG: protein kinase [Bacillota bacterium]|nr:protein kinase [Bacillota bacterium]